MLSDFHFLRPWWLLALLPAALLVWRIRRADDSRRAWRGVVAEHLLPHLLVGKDERARVRPVGLLAFGLLVAILAVAGPTWRREPAPFADDTAALVIVLKVTPSMLSEDVQPT